MIKIEPTDAHYALGVLRDVRTASLFLSGTDVEYSSVGALGFLFQTLEEMKTRKPFSASPGFLSASNGLANRDGVWDRIDEVLVRHQGSAVCETKEQRAEWFQDVLKLVRKHFEVKELIDVFRQNLARIDLGLSVGDASEAVSLILDPELTGRDAYALAQDVVAELEVAMTEYVKQHSPRTDFS